MKLYTSQEAADFLRLSKYSLDRYACDGSGPDYIQRKARGPRLYDEQALVQWLEKHTVRSLEHA